MVIMSVIVMVWTWVAFSVGQSLGYRAGVDDGIKVASGWRDELIKKYKTMVEEAIRQRDEARANRIVMPPPPNPFASKEWN